MRLGAPVVVTRDAGSQGFVGRRGIVVALEPLMVQLVGERAPLRFDAPALAPWTPRQGSIVVVVDRRSSFHMQRGLVIDARPFAVRVDLGGERLPLWFSPRELAPYRATAKLSAPSRRPR